MEEADWIASEIRAGVEREGRCWADFAVLYRLNAQSRALEDAFVRRGMPYRIRGAEPFYDRPEIRTALAYLHLALDREDDVALALLLGGVPGIGPKRLEDMRQMAASRGVSLFDFVAARPNTLGLPDAVASRVAELSGRIGRVQGRRAAPLLELVEYAIEATEADASLLRSDEEAVRDNLLELVSVAQEHVARRGTLRTFLDITALDPDRTAPRSGISCMTLHGAKGLEFPVVYIAGLEEGLLPHGRSLDREADVEEERRLCYVGMTRAQDRLGLSYARARLLGGQALIGHASRFVGEIGAENVTIRVSPTLKTKPRLLTVRPGERVVHPRWQTGTVLEVEGRGRDTVVTIHFDGAGRQRLQLCHAPLRPVGEGRRGDLAG
jgi:DNA helicase-2/ATP-dependent DNA helicase PcrA